MYGRCYAKYGRKNINLANVMATVVWTSVADFMETILLTGVVWYISWCYCHKWQVEWPLYKGVYFNLSSGMLNRTSSYACDRWYFPVFLLRDGLLILMYIDPFMKLVRFWSSPTILKFSTVVAWSVVLLWSYTGEALKCSLNLLPNILMILQYILHHTTNIHI